MSRLSYVFLLIQLFVFVFLFQTPSMYRRHTEKKIPTHVKDTPCGRWTIHQISVCQWIKGHYQVFFWVLIDLIIDFLVLIIKTFDNQTGVWNPVSMIWLSSHLTLSFDNQWYFWYLVTKFHPVTVHVGCRTLTSQDVLCLVRFIHWEESPVTVWNMVIVHTGEVRPFMHRTVWFGLFLRVCASFDSVSHRWSTVSLSTSFSCDSLNTFTILSYPCRFPWLSLW